MRRVNYRPYVILIVFFFCLMSFPKRGVDKMRAIAICSLSPSWSGLNFLKEKSLFLLSLPTHRTTFEGEREIERLAQENHLLRSQMENVRDWLLSEDRIQEQMELLKHLNAASGDFFKRRSAELARSLELQIKSIPAKVIFREAASWSSTVWINVGEKNNRSCQGKVICKNSPVLVGTSIIGVIEEVRENQSSVRLITDARLTPSVRATRGKGQQRFLLNHVDSLLFSLQRKDDLFSDQAQFQAVLKDLFQLKQRLMQESGEFFLAKGELRGSSHPLWRSRGQILKGFGFNYDFADLEGGARDLRSGAFLFGSQKRDAIPLLKEGDLLLTSGLDGIFPAGFKVAIVSKVQQLKEGASAYEIEAIPTAGNLDELCHVNILPPLQEI